MKMKTEKGNVMKRSENDEDKIKIEEQKCGRVKDRIEKEKETLKLLVQKKEIEIEGQTEEESLQKEWSTILDEKEEATSEKFEDVKTFEEVAANILITPRIRRNSSLTDDTVKQTNCDQCDVVVYDRGKLKYHIRRNHGKGHCDVKQVRARGCERGRRIRDD